jgi:hypothetical protein
MALPVMGGIDGLPLPSWPPAVLHGCGDPPVEVVEFFHVALDHYFITWSPTKSPCSMRVSR